MTEASDSEMNQGVWLRALVRYFTGPQLYKRYRTFQEPSRMYSPNFFESKADTVLSVAGGVKAFCMFSWPVLLPFLYHKGYLNVEWGKTFAISALLVYGGSYLVRGLGRMANPDYKTFLTVLDITTRYNTPSNKRFLREFDFEFWAWPKDYVFKEEMAPKFLPHLKEENRTNNNSATDKVMTSLASFAAKNIGISLLYPGSTSLYGLLVKAALIEGRTKIMEKDGGQRCKLVARNKESVDCVFLDRRNRVEYPNGNILVISCEGNAGYYEIGSFGVAAEAGYSVLGWNHPGFGGSTGLPWPKNDAAAVEAVVQYATHQLGFNMTDILIMAWSIGGYPATWAAMNFPEIRGLFLDATFDDLLPLAVPRMPSWAGGIVKRAVRQHLDLPISRMLAEYQGPVTLVRRTRDEIICTEEENLQAQRRSNRAKQLLKDLLRARYPTLMDENTEKIVDHWLDAENEAERLISDLGVDEEVCCDWLISAITANDNGDKLLFPITIGKELGSEDRQRLALFLASRYLTDFDTTHCTPLPPHMFVQPAHPWEILID